MFNILKLECMNRLSEILKEQGRTQAYLSRKMGKSPNTVNNWCRNNTKITLADAKLISEILNCSMEDLLLEEDKKEEKK
ncbi:MAG: helix-turn-helix transcriptional regulator [Crocinitomicaceae bacterium]|nr:helix-turn-helix transcriptional regulator [Crocinitomicaceae bacterium]